LLTQDDSKYIYTGDTVNSNGSICIRTNTDDDDIIFRIEDDSGNYFLLTTLGADLQDSEWHLFSWVVDRGNDLTHVYIDGGDEYSRINVDMSVVTDVITLSEDPNTWIGKRPFVSSYTNMDIAEFRIWSDVRTAQEIQDNAYETLAGTESNLVRYYTFDDGTGATVTDMVDGGSNDGTLFNTPDWIEPIPANLGESSTTIPSGIEDAVELTIDESYRPDRDLDDIEHPNDYANMWAVTGYGESDVSDYYWVSVSGMIVDDIDDLDGWNLAMSLWSGLAIAHDEGASYTAHLYGSAGYDAMLTTAGLADISFPDEGGTGSATYYFPWRPGYVAFYGTKGIHTDVGPVGTGYGGQGWLAVDWVGGTTYSDNVYQNAVYASQSGTVSYVCQDSVQTWVQIGNFLYGHLNDNETL